MEDNVIINKCEIIARCLLRAHEEYERSEGAFLTNYSRQDAALLNLERAVQAAIDLAAHVVRKKSLSVPKESRDLFDALLEAKIISAPLCVKMRHMVGFRNLLVHEYQKINIKIVENIIKCNLSDFREFVEAIVQFK